MTTKPRTFFFGCWNEPGHGLFGPGGVEIATDSLDTGEWIDGMYAPRRRLRDDALIWDEQGAGGDRVRWCINNRSGECPQGEYLLHHGVRGYTVISWWDRTQGDDRPACSSTFLLEGDHDELTMLMALAKCFPHVLANLARAGIALRPARPHVVSPAPVAADPPSRTVGEIAAGDALTWSQMPIEQARTEHELLRRALVDARAQIAAWSPLVAARCRVCREQVPGAAPAPVVIDPAYGGIKTEEPVVIGGDLWPMQLQGHSASHLRAVVVRGVGDSASASATVQRFVDGKWVDTGDTLPVSLVAPNIVAPTPAQVEGYGGTHAVDGDAWTLVSHVVRHDHGIEEPCGAGCPASPDGPEVREFRREVMAVPVPPEELDPFDAAAMAAIDRHDPNTSGRGPTPALLLGTAQRAGFTVRESDALAGAGLLASLDVHDATDRLGIAIDALTAEADVGGASAPRPWPRVPPELDWAGALRWARRVVDEYPQLVQPEMDLWNAANVLLAAYGADGARPDPPCQNARCWLRDPRDQPMTVAEAFTYANDRPGESLHVEWQEERRWYQIRPSIDGESEEVSLRQWYPDGRGGGSWVRHYGESYGIPAYALRFHARLVRLDIADSSPEARCERVALGDGSQPLRRHQWERLAGSLWACRDEAPDEDTIISIREYDSIAAPEFSANIDYIRSKIMASAGNATFGGDHQDDAGSVTVQHADFPDLLRFLVKR